MLELEELLFDLDGFFPEETRFFLRFEDRVDRLVLFFAISTPQ